ncbi:MAG: cofactor-independent phosphoglycerate mutase [Deltaproteobacteria bacterium]|nr:cofactor-independent phosphoglycerate mutase [Deltaproteobacteria bacterium]
MKYVILLGDGMADYPIKELGDKTPLKVAKKEAMDAIARGGTLGMVKTIPQGISPGSDIANLSILGYDPKRYYTGRAVYEAASSGVKLGSGDVAFRCNLVTLSEDDGETIMEDYSAGHITTDEARKIINELDQKLGNNEIRFYPGVSYRHLVVWKDGKEEMETTPPHDISGKDAASYLPSGEGAEKILQLMDEARKILNDNPVNRERVAALKSPANSIWLWGQGKPISLPSFKEKYGLTGSVISAVDLIKGIGVTLGLSPIKVPGATGYLDTNYLGKAEYALKELEKKDFVFLHVEAPDEAAHTGDIDNKIAAIEDFDAKVVKTVLEGMRQFEEYKIMVLPDHRTPIVKKTHTSEAVPFAFCSSASLMKGAKQQVDFSEESAERSGLSIENGFDLMDFFIKN